MTFNNHIMPSTKHVTQQKIQQYMPYSHQVLCLACQESCLTPQLLWQHLSKNDSCHTSWLNAGNPGTLLTVLCSPKPTKKAGRAKWGESLSSKMMTMMMMISSTTNHASVYHLNPVDESDDFLSDSSYHHNYKHDNLSSELLCQDEEPIFQNN